MDGNKAQNFGVNPFEDDADSSKASHFSDDEGPDEDKSAKKKEKKQKNSRVVDEDLLEDQDEVKHTIKKKIKGYKSDVKEYVSKVVSKGQRSELKDSLAEEGAFADKDLAVKKKRKRKRRKKINVSEAPKEEKVSKISPVSAAVEPEISSEPEIENVVPVMEEKSEEEVSDGVPTEIGDEIVEEEKPEGFEPEVEESELEPDGDMSEETVVPESEEPLNEEPIPEAVVPGENVSSEEAVVPEEVVASEEVKEPQMQEEGIFNPFESNVANEPVVSELVVPEPIVSGPVMGVNPFATTEEKKEDVKPINPFSESPQNDWGEPKWNNFPEDKKHEEEKFVSDDRVNNVHEESVSEAITPEIVENRNVSEEPKSVTVEQKTVSNETHTTNEVVSDLHDRDGFLFMLEQAGITKGKIIGTIVAILIVISLIISAFFIPFGSIFGGSGKPDNTAKNQQTEQPKTVVTPKTETATPQTQSATEGLNMSEILGNEYESLVLGNDKISGAFFALSLGGEFVSSEHRFSYYMRHLNEMQNLYATDVYKLLDQSYDRRATLTDFLNKMKVSIETGKQIQNEVAKAASNLSSAATSTASQETTFETSFFTNIKDLRGQDSFTNLEKYIGFSQNAIRLRSYYKAYNYISQMYANSLKNIEPRYQDILVNFDVLVKGVHVFDVTGSDINAIIRLSK